MSQFQHRGPTTGQLGQVSVALRRYARFTDSNDDVRMAFNREIVELRWKWNRIGGCGNATVVLATDPKATSYLDELTIPDHVLLQSGELYGGNFEIWVRLFPDVVSDTLTDKSMIRVYTGRIKRMEFNPVKGETSIFAEGLGAVFDELFLDEDIEDSSVRTIVNDIVDLVTKGTTASEDDGPLLGKNIIVPTNIIDLVIPQLKARAESASEVLERAISFVPGRYVWGVDRNGEFFLFAQDDVYDAQNQQIAVDGYILDHQVVSFTRVLRLDKLKTEFEVQGKMNEETTFRVKGQAANQRYKTMFGPRQVVKNDSDITDPSLASKLAQALGRETANEIIEGTLTVVEDIQPQKSFRHSITPFAAPVYISERSGQVSRVMGDSDGFALYLEGNRGEYFEIAEDALYKRTNTFLWHFDVRFEAAPEAVGINMIIGQQNPNMNADGLHGLGYFGWQSADGTIQFLYTNSTTTANVAIDTLINVPIAGPFPITKSITVAAAIGGSPTLSFYDGKIKTREIAITGTFGTGGIYNGPWRAIKSHFTAHGETKLSFNNWCYLSTATFLAPDVFATYPEAFDNWVAENSEQRLPMNAGRGLIAWAEMIEDQDSRTTMPVKRPDGLALQDITLNKVATFSTHKDRIYGDAFVSPEWYQGLTWGGPLVLNARSVDYTIEPRIGKVRKKFELGSKELTLPNLVAQVKRELKTTKDVLSKTAQNT